MRFLEAFLLSPFFTLAVALVLVVIAPKLSSHAETGLLALSVLLMGISVYRTAPISAQDIFPRILMTVAITAISGLLFFLIVGWRPIFGPKPPTFLAIANDVEYPSGTILGGIPWSSRFGDTRLVIAGGEDYRDLDIVIRPNAPIVAIGQISNLDVRFSPVADPTFTQQLIVGSTQQRMSNPLVLISTTGGYRIRCALLPHNEKLELLVATADVIDFPTAGSPQGSIFSRDYALKLEFTNPNTKLKTGNWYGHGIDAKGLRIEEVFKSQRHLPTSVEIDGSVGYGDEKITIKRTLDVRDVIADAVKKLTR